MVTAQALGFSAVRAHTLGVSSGLASQGLALNPKLNVFNDKAFDSMDYAITQVRRLSQQLITSSSMSVVGGRRSSRTQGPESSHPPCPTATFLCRPKPTISD
jgi:hypothetical protein